MDDPTGMERRVDGLKFVWPLIYSSCVNDA